MNYINSKSSYSQNLSETKGKIKGINQKLALSPYDFITFQETWYNQMLGEHDREFIHELIHENAIDYIVSGKVLDSYDATSIVDSSADHGRIECFAYGDI